MQVNRVVDVENYNVIKESQAENVQMLQDQLHQLQEFQAIQLENEKPGVYEARVAGENETITYHGQEGAVEEGHYILTDPDGNDFAVSPEEFEIMFREVA